MWTDRQDGRVLGSIFAILGLIVMGIYLWGRIEDGDGNTTILLSAFLLLMSGSLLTQYKSKKDDSDAG